MKKVFLFGAFVVAAVSGRALALDMTYTEYANPGKGTATNQPVQISSVTVTTITPVSDYMEVLLSTCNVKYFYRIDNSTINIPTVGFPVEVGSSATIRCIKGYPLNILAAPAASSATIRGIVLEPK